MAVEARSVLAVMLACLAFGTAAPEGRAAGGGSQAWQQAGCGRCHTLAAEGSTGDIGPNLDQVRPSAATVALKVRYGSGVMPAYSGTLSDAQIQELATYVASVAGKKGGTSATPARFRRAHVAADMALARRALLVRRDLGAGWKPRPVPSTGAPLTCSSFAPDLGGVVETGAASSRVFAQASGGLSVSQASFVYATAAQATILWRRVVGPGLYRCLAERVKSGATPGVSFTRISRGALRLPRLGGRIAGYRVEAKGVTAGKTLKRYLDMVVLARGRTVTGLSFAGRDRPAARQLELQLARIVASRLQGP
jgi:cytochrome c6